MFGIFRAGDEDDCGGNSLIANVTSIMECSTITLPAITLNNRNPPSAEHDR